MKKIFLVLIAFIFKTATYSQSLADTLDHYFSESEKAQIFNGSVKIVRNGKILLDKGYGYSNVEKKSPNNANTIFQIGSVTKQFTSTVILKLAEQGKLSVSDKLNKYFPGFTNADKITIENLLTHTSGIYNYTNDTAFMQHDVEKAFNEQKLLDMIKDKPPGFEPGSKFSYSNSGYLLLGYIIEKVTGKKYEQVVREQIFVPLDMRNSGFDFTHLSNENKATGYNSLNPPSKSLIVDSSVSFSAGAIYSTVEDMYKWNQAVARGNTLKAASLQNAFTPRLSKYGLGWGIDSLERKRLISHNGGIHGFLSSNSIIPEDSISITILSNSGSAKMGRVQKDVYAILYSKPYKLPELNKEVAVDTTILKHYVGVYELSPAFKITISLVNGALKAQATNQQQVDLFAKSDSLFFLKVVDAQVEFVNNEKGVVDKLILHQGGQSTPASKIK